MKLNSKNIVLLLTFTVFATESSQAFFGFGDSKSWVPSFSSIGNFLSGTSAQKKVFVDLSTDDLVERIKNNLNTPDSAFEIKTALEVLNYRDATDKVESLVTLLIQEGSIDILDKALKAKLIGFCIDKNGQYKGSALEAAIYKKDDSFFIKLLPFKASVQSLIDAFLDNSISDKKKQLIIRKIASLDEEESSKALEFAVKNGEYGLASKLLEAGVRGQVDSEGRTLLHVACKNLNYGMVRLLIDHGFDVNATSEKLLTPIMVVAWRAKPDPKVFGEPVSVDNDAPVNCVPQPINELMETAKLLVENGADLDTQGPDGQLPWQMAEAQGNQELENYLYEKTPASQW